MFPSQPEDSDSDGGGVVGWRGGPKSRHAMVARLAEAHPSSQAAALAARPVQPPPVGQAGPRHAASTASGDANFDFLDAFRVEEPLWDEAEARGGSPLGGVRGFLAAYAPMSDQTSDEDASEGVEEEDEPPRHVGGEGADGDEELEEAEAEPPPAQSVLHTARTVARTGTEECFSPGHLWQPGEPSAQLPPQPQHPPAQRMPPPQQPPPSQQAPRPRARPPPPPPKPARRGAPGPMVSSRDELIRQRPKHGAHKSGGGGGRQHGFGIREEPLPPLTQQVARANGAPSSAGRAGAAGGAPATTLLSPVPLAARLRMLTSQAAPAGHGTQARLTYGLEEEGEALEEADGVGAAAGPAAAPQPAPPGVGRTYLGPLLPRLKRLLTEERGRRSGFEKRVAGASAAGAPLPPGAADFSILHSRREGESVALSCRLLAIRPLGQPSAAALAELPASAGEAVWLFISSPHKLRLETGRQLRVHAPLHAVRLRDGCGTAFLASWNVTQTQ